MVEITTQKYDYNISYIVYIPIIPVIKFLVCYVGCIRSLCCHAATSTFYCIEKFYNDAGKNGGGETRRWI
jgi:hypothetical protein